MKDKSVSIEKDKNIDKSLDSWKAALIAAQDQYRDCKNRLNQLKGSIRIFEQKINSGEPYP